MTAIENHLNMDTQLEKSLRKCAQLVAAHLLGGNALFLAGLSLVGRGLLRIDQDLPGGRLSLQIGERLLAFLLIWSVRVRAVHPAQFLNDLPLGLLARRAHPLKLAKHGPSDLRLAHLRERRTCRRATPVRQQ